jgi:hypothetical protein
MLIDVMEASKHRYCDDFFRLERLDETHVSRAHKAHVVQSNDADATG